MCRKPQGASWCGHPLTHRSCAPRDHGHSPCVRRESESKILLIRAKEKTPEGQRKHGAWNAQDVPLMGFGGSNTEGSQQWQFHEFCTKPSLLPHLILTARLVQYEEKLVLILLHPLAL